MSLSYIEAIAANLAMGDLDPDFILTINGQDVGSMCLDWEFKDAEEGMSQISATLANPEKRLSGKFKWNQEVRLRFGYVGALSEPAHLMVSEVKERYPQSAQRTIKVIARDQTQKIGGGSNTGNYGKGDDAAIAARALEARDIKMEQGGTPTQNERAMVHNQSDNEVIHNAGQSIDPGDGSGGGNDPKSPLADEKSKDIGKAKKDEAAAFSSAERLARAQGRDGNRAKNQGNKAGSEPIKGSLHLKGFPTLRAKTTVAVQDFGDEASGTYYVKECTHKWSRGNGYTTDAQLVRGGTGKGGVGGKPFMVFHANVWKNNSAYLGPRKTDQTPAVTFRDGDRHLMDFEFHSKPQSQRHGGEPKQGVGRGVDIYNKNKSFATNENRDLGEGAGITGM
jgi:hypothetical protein